MQIKRPPSPKATAGRSFGKQGAGAGAAKTSRKGNKSAAVAESKGAETLLATAADEVVTSAAAVLDAATASLNQAALLVPAAPSEANASARRNGRARHAAPPAADGPKKPSEASLLGKEVAASIVEMGLALAAPRPASQQGGATAGARKWRQARSAAQSFVDEAGDGEEPPARHEAKAVARVPRRR